MSDHKSDARVREVPAAGTRKHNPAELDRMLDAALKHIVVSNDQDVRHAPVRHAPVLKERVKDA